MKKVFLTVIFGLTMLWAQAQIEVKLNPIGTLFGSPDLSGEYIVNDNFGAELTLGLEMGTYGMITVDGDGYDPKKSGFNVMASGKYYFSPDDGCDGMYAGLYLRDKSFKVDDKNSDYSYGYKRNSFSGGMLVGYKWVADSGLVFEIGAGGGRTFSDKIEWLDEDGSELEDFSIRIDVIGKLAIGYRF